MVGHDRAYPSNEYGVEAEVKRIVGKLAALTESKPLEPCEHSRLLQDLERLLELKVQRQRGL